MMNGTTSTGATFLWEVGDRVVSKGTSGQKGTLVEYLGKGRWTIEWDMSDGRRETIRTYELNRNWSLLPTNLQITDRS